MEIVMSFTLQPLTPWEATASTPRVSLHSTSVGLNHTVARPLRRTCFK